MKISCEIIQDLLPLYRDNVCSSKSRTTVEEHLLECDTCKKYLDSINNNFIQNTLDKITEQAKADTLKGIKKKLFRKNVMISVISILCAIVVFLGAFSLLFYYEKPISYVNGLVSVSMAHNGAIDVTFNGDDYYCSYEWTALIEKDGIKQYVAYIYYTDTIWTKYFSRPQKDTEYKYSINNSSWIDYGNGGGAVEIKKDIAAVYYLDYSDIEKLSKEELLKNSSKAVLLWKK